MEQVNNDFSSEVMEFRSLIRDLHEYIEKPDVDYDTKIVIQDLALTLRYQLEFDVMKKLVSENDSLKETETLIKNMIDKIELYKNFILEEHKKTGLPSMDIKSKIKLTAMERSLKRLTELKTTIESRNFNSYVVAMNNQVSSSKQLISIIRSVLTDGYNDYFSSSLIKNGEVDENIMTIIYSIIKDKGLFDELKKYITEEKRIEDLKNKLEEEKKFFDLLKKSENYITLFKRFINLYQKKSSNEESEINLRESLDEDYGNREYMSNQKYSRALYNAPLRKLEHEIYEKEEKLRKIALQRSELASTEQKLKNAGFEKIIDAFKTEIGESNTLYDKFAIYIKSKANSNSYDIDSFLKSFEERLDMKQLEINVASRKLEKSLDEVYPLAKKLVTNYHDDTVKIVDLFSDDDLSKIIAFYVLDLLCSAKKFDVQKLSSVYANKDELREIFSNMQNQLTNDIEKINEEALQVESDADKVMNKS